MKKSIILLFLLFILTSCATFKVEPNYIKDTLKVSELDDVLLSKLDLHYTDLDLTKEEIDVIKKYQNEELYAAVTEWPFYYHSVKEDNKEYIVGIDHYLFEQLRKVFDINIKVKVFDYFENFMNSIYEGDTHIAGGIYYSDERNEKGIYSIDYINEQVYLYSKDNLIIENPSDLDGLVSGKLKGSEFFGDFIRALKKDNINYIEKEYDTFEDLMNAIESGEVDYAALPYNDKLIKHGFKNLDITNIVNKYVGQSSKSYIYGTKQEPDLRILFSAFNKAIEHGIKENISLYQANYHNALLLNGDYFTEEEKNLINRSKQRPVMIELNFDSNPYCYFNEETSKWEGQSVHIFETISRISGLNYKIVNKPGYSWDNILNDLGKNGQIPKVDGTLGIAISEDRKEFLDYTDSTYISKLVVVGKSTSEEILYLSDLYNYRVGTIPGFYTKDILYENLNNIEVVDYDTTYDLVEAIKNDEIDYFITYDSKFNKLYYDKGEYSLAIKHVATNNLFFSNGFSKTNKDSELIVSIYNKILPIVNLGKINQEHFGNTVDLSQVIDKKELRTNIAWVVSVGLFIFVTVIFVNMIKFRRLSLIDGLTGLKNRNAFNKLFNKVLLSDKSIMFIDIDNFKAINNLYGHSAGDFTLKEIASKLKRIKSDIYRLGGDEFLLVSKQLTEKEIETIHKELNCKVIYQDSVIKVHATSAVVHCNDYKFLSFEDLANLLSFSVRAGKREGKNLMIRADDTILDIYKTKKNLETKLHNAINNKEFIPYFQPYINVQTQKVVGAEVLARWQHEDNIYSPIVFHELAEATGLIYDIDLLMFEENLKLLRKLKDNNLVSERFEVTSNFSPYTLGKLDVSHLEELLEKYNLTKSHIGLEVTEQLLLNDNGFDKVRELQDRGFTIAIDDFSAGHSSLVYLLDLKVKYLKMDKSLLSNVNSDLTNENYIVYEAISKLANKLGIVVISEGVETKEQENVLRGLHIEFAQGYHYSKPIDKEKFIKLVEKDH